MCAPRLPATRMIRKGAVCSVKGMLLRHDLLCGWVLSTRAPVSSAHLVARVAQSQVEPHGLPGLGGWTTRRGTVGMLDRYRVALPNANHTCVPLPQARCPALCPC